MLQHNASRSYRIFFYLQYVSDCFGILVNDRGVRYHEDNAIHPVKLSMAQGEAQAGQGLSSSSRHCKGKNSSLSFGRGKAMIRNRSPQLVNSAINREAG